MKRLINTLRKLGILRFGTVSGKYKSTKDMPTELFMDNVYDSAKDLVNREDVKRVSDFFNKAPKKKSPEGIRKLFYYAVIGFGVLFSLMFLGNLFSFWFLITLILWVWFFKRTKVFYISGTYSFNSMLVLFVLVFFISFILLGFSAGTSSTKSKTTSKSTVLQEYEGKTLNITSEDGSISGKGVLKAYTNSIHITYFLLIKDNLSTNGGCVDVVGDWCKDDEHILIEERSYSYLINFEGTDNATVLYSVYCNEDKLWENATNLSGHVNTTCDVDPLAGWKTTDTFYAKNGASFDSYEDLLSHTTLTLYDISDFDRFEETTTDKSPTLSEVSFTYDEVIGTDRVVKQYAISFVE